MPELPEVETVVRGLYSALHGRIIRQIGYERAKVIEGLHPDEFAARIAGQGIRSLGRRGKYIVMQLDHDTLIVHLRMTGRLYVASTGAVLEADRWLRWWADLDNGQQLRFSDARRFGRVYLASDPASVLGRLGPEPLGAGFTAAVFYERIRGRSRAIKVLLMDQAFVAGVGNIYADEALFRAGLHPLRRAADLSEEQARTLHESMQSVLREAINHEGASVNWYRKPDGTSGSSQEHFFVYDREGLPCLRCGHTIAKIRVAQRGTHFCPVCQPVHG